MKYFKDILGQTTYDGKTIINFFRRVNFNIVDNAQYLVEYIIKDGETPESISYKLYNTVDFWWTIMLINGKFDRFYDFPLPHEQLEAYIQLLVDDDLIDDANTVEKNNIRTLNDAKRNIYVIDEKFIKNFIYYVKELMEG